MTPWQRLTLVELPLAVPVLLGGVRVAAVASVGMATIAAAIGAKGLGLVHLPGDLALRPPADPARLGPRRPAGPGLRRGARRVGTPARPDPTPEGRLAGSLWPSRRRRPWSALGLVRGLGRGGVRPEVDRTIVVGSKDSAEPVILGHMLADLVEAHTPLKADRRLNLAARLICYNALKQGGLDAYVEYTGTALTTILKQAARERPGPRSVRGRVEIGLAKEGISALAPDRLREHLRHPDAARPGRVAGHPVDLRPGQARRDAPDRVRPRVHEPARRVSRGWSRPMGSTSRSPPGRDGPEPALSGPLKARSTSRRATRPTAGSPRSTWSSSSTTAATSRPTRPSRWSAPRRL